MPPKYRMSDSESEAEAEAPSTHSDHSLEKALREQVASIFKSGNMAELTVKRVRHAVENKLGLTAEYFKTTGDWKKRSEEIIKEEFDTQDAAAQNPEPPAKKLPSPAPQKQALTKRSKSASVSQPRKRQKTKTPVSDDENESAPSVASDGESDEVTTSTARSKPVKKAPGKSKKPTKEDSEASDVAGNTSDVPEPTTTKDDSESEMSVVMDEEPKPKAARKPKKSADGPSKPKKAPKAKPKAKDEDISPDQAEIKRLQGWLIKCGIRKLWGKELAPFDTPKAKIKHLRGMLEDAGMKGRPSQERANQIREERELKADLELITEGEKTWGAKSEEEDDDKPRRRLNRGRQSLAFLDSDDGEETD
ncbi:unnamed protein product [Penicillium salamii]|uniref:Transcriptional regulator n=1 Tax=Penicillium salamii TaxID=1612424 RepID=A0A9W4IDR4_9EURO|nr:unnamed protein product [Penicillium salamii]CAG8234691.1 unnamed protein product [Penicillium salamii]CAG8255767.1 unnamed protein product [Penicillium salamii]CAG8260769.1 unnamed protein product [Penicillium salamii]CAG8348240.1 unnamed protein product [Penicillium salamii]